MDDTEMAIHVRGLQKHFGKVHALRGLDLDVPTGQVTGFLGPNGAGKSTTIRILLGLLRSDGGTAEVLGRDPWRDAVDLHRSVQRDGHLDTGGHASTLASSSPQSSSEASMPSDCGTSTSFSVPHCGHSK